MEMLAHFKCCNALLYILVHRPLQNPSHHSRYLWYHCRTVQVWQKCLKSKHADNSTCLSDSSAQQAVLVGKCYFKEINLFEKTSW